MENKRVESAEQALEAKGIYSNKAKSTNNKNIATASNTGIATGLTEISSRYGEASKEFLVALDGIR